MATSAQGEMSETGGGRPRPHRDQPARNARRGWRDDPEARLVQDRHRQYRADGGRRRLLRLPLDRAAVRRADHDLRADRRSRLGRRRTCARSSISCRPMPRKLIYEQLVNVTTTAASKKGLGLLVALAVSLYGATRASGAIMAALNVIYEQVERRSIVRTTLISFVMIIARGVRRHRRAARRLGARLCPDPCSAASARPARSLITVAHLGGRRHARQHGDRRDLPLRARPRRRALALADARLGAGDVAVARWRRSASASTPPSSATITRPTARSARSSCC